MAVITTRLFINKAYLAALVRSPTPSEFASWRASLNQSWAAGSSTLLIDAKARLASLFNGSAYTARSTSNAQFIADMFGAYYARTATAGEVTTWTTYLGSNSRAVMVTAFGVSAEFATRVATIKPADSFPMPEFGGPWIAKLLPSDPGFDDITQFHRFEDSGQSTNLTSDVASQKWDIDYTGADPLEAQMLDEHYDDAMGMNWGFDFTDRQGVLWANTHYDTGGSTRDHEKVWIQQRKRVLIWRPY